MSIQSKGKLDIYIASFVAHLLNKHLSLSLFHAHFAFAVKQGKAKEYSESYSNMLQSISKGVEKLCFDKVTYQAYRDKIVSFAQDAKTSENTIQAVLLELERTLSDMIIARDTKMNHYFEKLAIGTIVI